MWVRSVQFPHRRFFPALVEAIETGAEDQHAKCHGLCENTRSVTEYLYFTPHYYKAMLTHQSYISTNLEGSLFCLYWPYIYIHTVGSPYPLIQYPRFATARKKIGKLNK
jgi:hypothetical protein